MSHNGPKVVLEGRRGRMYRSDKWFGSIVARRRTFDQQVASSTPAVRCRNSTWMDRPCGHVNYLGV